MKPWLIVLVCVGVLSCTKDKPAAPLIRPVRYELPTAIGAGRLQSYSGVSRSGSASKLSFKVPGTVQKILVKLGSKVKKGALIAELESEDYQLKVQQARASLKQAEAQKRNATASYDRVRELYEDGTASQTELDGARAAAESATAGVRAIRKQWQLAKRQHTYTRLVSPVTGTVDQVLVEESENVQAGQPIVVASGGDVIEVDVQIPENLIGALVVGQSAKIRFEALDKKTYSAEISEVGSASTALVTTFPVTLKLKELDARIRPGMAAEAIFTIGDKSSKLGLFVRSEAVSEDTEGRFVFVLKDSEKGTATVHRRAVKVGGFQRQGLEILSGLGESDRVVTAGVGRLKEGQKVRLLEAEGAGE